MRHTTKVIIKSAILASFIVTLFAIGTTKVFASETDQCKDWHKIGTVIMNMRQLNAPISDLMQIAKNNPDFEAIMRVITIEAYDRPRYSTKEMQDNSIKEFANEVYLICYKANTEKEV